VQAARRAAQHRAQRQRRQPLGDYSARRSTRGPVHFLVHQRVPAVGRGLQLGTRSPRTSSRRGTAAQAGAPSRGPSRRAPAVPPLSGVVVELDNGFAAATGRLGRLLHQGAARHLHGDGVGPGPQLRLLDAHAAPGLVVGSGGIVNQNFCMTGGSTCSPTASASTTRRAGTATAVINRNECVRVDIAVKNAGCANETGISATLTTSTRA